MVLGRRVQQTLLAGNLRMRTWEKFSGELYFYYEQVFKDELNIREQKRSRR